MRNCEAYEEWISAFLDGELSGAEQAELMKHMFDCRRCQRYFDDLVAIHEALGQENEVPVPEGFEDRIMARVRETAQERPAKAVRFPQWRRWAALAACCVVAAMGLWSFRSFKGADQMSMEAAVTANTPHMAMDAGIPVEDGRDGDALVVMMDEAPQEDMDRIRMAGGADENVYAEEAEAKKDTEQMGRNGLEDAAAPPAGTPESDSAAPAGSGAVTDAEILPNQPEPSPTEDRGLITSEDAKSKALAHAGLADSQVTFTEVKLEWEDGRQVYDVEFYAASAEYGYEIDAATGEVVKFDYDAESASLPVPGDTGGAAIALEKAREIALAKVPGAAAEHVVKLKLDYDDGRAVYEVEIIYDNTEYEMEIDAVDGRILEFEAEPVHKR